MHVVSQSYKQLVGLIPYLWIVMNSVQSSGTTITFVIVEGSVITVASVGDSRCILEYEEGGLYYL